MLKKILEYYKNYLLISINTNFDQKLFIFFIRYIEIRYQYKIRFVDVLIKLAFLQLILL